MTTNPDLIRELQSHADDIRHLQQDMKDFKQDINMKFEQRDEKHDELEETLQGVLRSQERLNDTLKDFIQRFEEPYKDWLQRKHGPEWVKQLIEHYKIVGLVLLGAVAVWKIDVFFPMVLEALGAK